MSVKTAEVVICGAGIAGIAAAYHLAVRRGVTDIVLVDERPSVDVDERQVRRVLPATGGRGRATPWSAS